MDVVERAHSGYGRNTVHMKTPRDAEYETIARVSHRLQIAATNRDKNFPAFVAALSENNALWTALAADVAIPENGLPEDLRAKLFWLAEFTAKETRRILEGRGDVDALIDVNSSVMQGLRGREVTS